ncbi:MAG: dienelactone hydrolase family protein [Chloroflexi bacterium]|nr:dienelactone hydrolase family protein [Chloroflexota bacterium]
MAWNVQRTDATAGMTAETMTIAGGGGDPIHAFIAQPKGPGPFPGVVIVHHAPGFDEWTREFARRFADHGFLTVAPNLYERFGHGLPDEVAAVGRTQVTDDSVVADAEAALNWIKAQPTSNGKVGVIGPCSGGRNAVLVASRVPAFDAVVDLWGGGVTADPTPQRPVRVIDMTPQLTAPLLGLFGNDDQGPSPAQVDQHEAALKEHGKTYQFHRYDGAGHGFFYWHAPSYRQQQAMDGWDKVVAWFTQHLS